MECDYEGDDEYIDDIYNCYNRDFHPEDTGQGPKCDCKFRVFISYVNRTEMGGGQLDRESFGEWLPQGRMPKESWPRKVSNRLVVYFLDQHPFKDMRMQKKRKSFANCNFRKRLKFIIGGIVITFIAINLEPGFASSNGSSNLPKRWTGKILESFFITEEAFEAIGFPALYFPFNLSFFWGGAAFLGYCVSLVWYKEIKFRVKHILLLQLLLSITLGIRMSLGLWEMGFSIDILFILLMSYLISQRYLTRPLD